MTNKGENVSLRALVGKSDWKWSDGQVIALGLETVLISNPSQSDLLSFGGDVVRRSLVSVSLAGLVFTLAVTAATAGADLFLDVGLVTGGAIRARVSSLRMILKPIKNLDTQ